MLGLSGIIDFFSGMVTVISNEAELVFRGWATKIKSPDNGCIMRAIEFSMDWLMFIY